MINQLVDTILQRVKDNYPGIQVPGAMRAVITSAAESGKTYKTECIIECKSPAEAAGIYECEVERKCYLYSVKVLGNDGSEQPQYPELIEIESRQQLEPGDVVQVVFLGNELEAAIVGG